MAVNTVTHGPPARQLPCKTPIIMLKLRTFRLMHNLLRSGRRHGLAGGLLDSGGRSGGLAFANVALGGRDSR